jgi:hypothetical protein
VCKGWRNPPWLPTRHCSVRAGLQYMSSVGLRRATAKGGVHARTCPSQGVPWRGSRTCEKAAQCEAREQESFSIWPRRGAPSVAHSERSPLFSFPRSPSWLVSCRDPRPWQHSYARKPFNLVVGRSHQQLGGVVCSLRRVLTPRVEVGPSACRALHRHVATSWPHLCPYGVHILTQRATPGLPPRP